MDIPGYKIHRLVGEGATASVFLATQKSLGRQVALKVLAPALAGQQGFKARFLKEGRIVAYLNHPQIVDIYDLGSHHHHHYLAMEYLSGGTLDQKIQCGLSTAQSVQLIKQISNALGFAHMNGVIHRDIKSQNIMFRQDGILVLTDFGIARLLDGDPQLTTPGRAVGSPSYMSPEQICGRKIDARADLYSVGVLFYQMLTNKLPYHSDQFLAIALMHKTEPIPVLPEDQSVLQPVVNKLLAKEPEQRYSSAQDLTDALMQIESKYPFLLEDSKGENGILQTCVKRSAAEQINICVVGRRHPTAEATRPAFELPSSVTGGVRRMAFKKNVAAERPDQFIRQTDEYASDPPKRSALKKAGLILTGMMLVLAVGLYLLDQFQGKPSSAIRKTFSAKVLATNANDAPHSAKDLVSAAVNQPNQNEVILRKDIQNRPSKTPTTVRPAGDQKIEELMAKAKRQLANYHLTSPVGDNCYETYQQLLSLDPSGQAAASVMAKIGDTYRQLALAEKMKGRLRQGLRYIDKGLELLPQNSTLLSLQADFLTRLDEKTRILKEQAQNNEQQGRKRAAEVAAIEKIRKVEQEIEARRRQELERERLARQMAEKARLEKQKENLEFKKPESTEQKTVSRKRLFGTF
jgi:serine/threonine-protein kinase PpkA